MNWYPLKNFTHYSLLKGYSKPEELAQKCADNDYPACGICDYKTISGAVAFYQACKKLNIKPIIGCSFDSFQLFAKNKNGWHDLIELVSSIDDNGNISNATLTNVLSKNNLIKLDNSDDKSLPSSYYTNQEDAKLHRILLCSEMKTTLPKIKKSLIKGIDDNILVDENKYPSDHLDKVNFFIHDTFYVKDKNESQDLDTKLLTKIYNQCEDYNILNQPMLPKFDCPNNLSEEEYLKVLARKGWRELLIHTGKVNDESNKKIYLDRFNNELQVIKDANLFGYFLIVQDIIRYVRDSGWLSGPGRGSAAGCLISYLIGITQIDPVEYDLLFERFYNAGRNAKGHISLPDIDMDVPGKKRDEVISYIKNKYGNNHVSQMITFGRMQGRSAIKEVLRINEACSFAEMNTITKSVPNEAEISDQLADMEDDERSIIRWALINRPNDLRDFCQISEDGTLAGDYAEYFQQAIDIEGTFKTQGKHAAGVVISADPLNKVCPMVKAKDSSEKIAGLEMSDLESLGHVKFDVLGINLLDKLMMIQDITGETNG
ncbi:MAG: PHP domain-containing protein [Proteobacteria bacterium]|nr:PHP domain-containing protein [Pseudomonadota bacterium]NBP13680.1 PHP domain-containing protein [bacterium]